MQGRMQQNLEVSVHSQNQRAINECMLACAFWAYFLSYTVQDPNPGSDAAFFALGLPTSVNVTETVISPYWDMLSMRHAQRSARYRPHWESLPGNSRLWQLKLTTTVGESPSPDHQVTTYRCKRRICQKTTINEGNTSKHVLWMSPIIGSSCLCQEHMMTYADLYAKEGSGATQGGHQQGATESGVQISGQTQIN